VGILNFQRRTGSIDSHQIFVLRNACTALRWFRRPSAGVGSKLSDSVSALLIRTIVVAAEPAVSTGFVK
jgi:hypothetical protein